MKVLITGANGFIGRSLVPMICAEDMRAVCAVRKSSNTSFLNNLPNVEVLRYSNQEMTDVGFWRQVLQDVDIVIHLAGRAHVLREMHDNPEDEYNRINKKFTIALARASAASEVNKFIFISTIGVHGKHSRKSKLKESSAFVPDNFYSRSKLEAEEAVRNIFNNTTTAYVILRPPLVYGEYVKGNFLSLLKWLHRGLPNIFLAVNNKRSFIYVANLSSIIIKCVRNPAADNQEFLVSDGSDLSTKDLVAIICSKMNKRRVALWLPEYFLRMMGYIFRKTDAVDSLVGSYVLDTTKLKTVLNWSPVYTVEAGIENAVNWYLEKHDK